jgi:hypothetical protein
MSGMRGLKAIAGAVTLAGALFAAPHTAMAGAYGLDVHVDGVTGGGNYSPGGYHWGDDPFVLAFTHTTDASTAALQALAQGKQEVGTALLHVTLQGTATVTLQMSGVRVESVKEDGDPNNGPLETVTLRFRKVVYTFQPMLPNGQKNGPPVTFTWNR